MFLNYIFEVWVNKIIKNGYEMYKKFCKNNIFGIFLNGEIFFFNKLVNVSSL